MPPQLSVIVPTTLGALAYLCAVYLIDRALKGENRAYFRYLAVIVSVVLFFGGVERVVPDAGRALGVKKAGIAIAAVGCIFYEQYRAGIRRPIA